MTNGIISKTMTDDSPLNVSKEIALVFSIANTLRGPYKSDKYKDVIIPMIIIRRLECALAKTKERVVKTYQGAEASKSELPDKVLYSVAGFPFYNRSRWTLKKLLDDPTNIASNFQDYIDGFSPNIQTMFGKKAGLNFGAEIEKMDTNNRLYGVVKKFSELDLNPETIDNIKMGYMFEEIIRKFSENAEAGDHYTPREVIRLLVQILTAEGIDDIYDDGKVVTVLDPACGSGGMLSATFEAVRRLNNTADVVLFGQEVNPESYAICLADMMIKGQKTENIRFQDTMKKEEESKQYCFDGTKMRLVIMNPPFGTAWSGKDAADGVEKAVREEYERGEKGRFSAGLPAGGDMQLLFMQVAIDKMDDNGRAAIIANGSPLFSGGTTSGESQIRKWMLDNDYIEAIVALPTDLFYNTGIGIYAFILSKKKRAERKNKIQLINAVDFFKPLRKSLGKKRRELSTDNIKDIVKIYSEFKPGKYCKIFDRDEFLYREYAVWQPLQRTGRIDAETVEALRVSALLTANASFYDEAAFEELNVKEPRTAKEDDKLKKLMSGRAMTEAIIATLKKNVDGKEYKDYAAFIKRLAALLGDIDGVNAKAVEKIAYEMSVMDKTAVVQKDKKGKVIYDPATKDSEIVRFNQNTEEYFKAEVYPHIPDAHYEWEGKSGAEFPFTRYFYEYKEPDKAEDLLAQFLTLEKSVAAQIARLQK
jgi:type I restriction enzyme M protein